MPVTASRAPREHARSHAEQADDVKSRQQRISQHGKTAFTGAAAAQHEQRRGDDGQREDVGENHIVQKLLERPEHERRQQHGRAEEQQPHLLHLGLRITRRNARGSTPSCAMA